jgi:transposase
MIGSSRSVRVWAYPRPADLRRGYNGLFSLVREGLNQNPLSGDLFLFVNKRRTSCKVLLWDGTGLCIFMKRLERGRFACLWDGDRDEPLRMTSSELALFIEGSRLVGRHPLSPQEVFQKSHCQTAQDRLQ